MRFIIIILLHVALFASSYDFNEFKFVSAVSTTFKKSGKIDTQGLITKITYKEPKYKQIIKNDENVSIKDSSGKIYRLKGKALYYTKMFINIMTRLGKFSEIKTNNDFDVQKDGDIYNLVFKGDLANMIVKAEVKTKKSKVLSFKLYMPNEDTLSIIKLHLQ